MGVGMVMVVVVGVEPGAGGGGGGRIPGTAAPGTACCVFLVRGLGVIQQ